MIKHNFTATITFRCKFYIHSLFLHFSLSLSINPICGDKHNFIVTITFHRMFPLHFLFLFLYHLLLYLFVSIYSHSRQCHPICFLTSDLTNQKQEPKNADCETSWLVSPAHSAGDREIEEEQGLKHEVTP